VAPGGYQDWLQLQESRLAIHTLKEQHTELCEVNGAGLAEQMGTILAAELASLTQRLFAEKGDLEERWKLLREALRELSRLRRDEQRRDEVTLKRERWEHELENKDHEEEMKQMEREKRSC
jgi:hypothetical protein